MAAVREVIPEGALPIAPSGTIPVIRPLPHQLRDASGTDYLADAWAALRDARLEPFDLLTSECWRGAFHGYVAKALAYVRSHARAFGSPSASHSGLDGVCVGPSAVHRGIREHQHLLDALDELLFAASHPGLVTIDLAVDLYEGAARLQAQIAAHQEHLMAASGSQAARLGARRSPAAAVFAANLR